MSTPLLSTTASPTSLLPMTRLAAAPGMLLRSKTPETIFVTAIEQREVLGDGFHNVALPAANERARFLKERKRAQIKYKIEHVPAVYSDREVEGRKNSNDSQRVRDYRKR